MRRPRITTLQSIAAHDVTGEPVPSRRLTAQRVSRAIARIFNDTDLCAIATIGTDGRAHVNTAYFAWSPRLALYFLSHPNARHCGSLRANPSAAIAVFDSSQQWGGLDRGLQLFGTCRETRGAAAREAAQVYSRRFKPYAAWTRDLAADDAAPEYRFYRFSTNHLKLFDEREFGSAIFVTATVRARQRRISARRRARRD